MRPHQAVVVGVDPGSERSGWSMWLRGVLVAAGEVAGLDLVEIAKVLEAALNLAELASVDAGEPVHVVLVIEQPPPATVVYAGRGAAGVAAVFGALKVWCAAAVQLGIKPRRIVKVPLATWRAAVLGKGFGRQREQVHLLEGAIARREVQRARRSGVQIGELGQDGCAGVCVGFYGTCAPAVGAALEPRARRVNARKSA